MDSLVEAMQAADGPWPVLALIILGLYALLWRFGNKILDLLRENAKTTSAAHARIDHVADSIVTNHGSKNIGDAVDRLTEAVQDIQGRLTALEDRTPNAA